MRIIIDVNFLANRFIPSSHIFIMEALTEMARYHQGVSFMLLTTAPVNVPDLPANVTIHYVKSGLLNLLGQKWWYTHMLARELKKLRADIFLSVQNLFVQSHPVPCCLLLPANDSVKQDTSGNKRNRRQNDRMSAAIRRADILLATSEHHLQHVQQLYGVPTTKIKMWQLPLPGTVRRLNWTEKESIKTQYSGGLEYFVFAGDIHARHRLEDLLKAFSQFKKWQQSNMQLLIAGRRTAYTSELLKKVSTYRYRNDVHFIIDPPDKTLNNIIGSAYASVYPATYDYLPFTVLLSMKAGVPVIASDIEVIHEFAGEAALYVKHDTPEGFASLMQVLYKDEQYRNEVIEKAITHVEEREQNGEKNDCWNILMQALPINS